MASSQIAAARLALLLGVQACGADEVQPASAMPRQASSGAETGVGTLAPDRMLAEPMARAASESGAAPREPLPPTGDLPDLVLDVAYLLDTTRFESQRIDDPCLVQQGCATGLGERRVVRFGSRMGNLGNADFVLGSPAQDNPLWSPNLCGDGFSLQGFARYELWDASGQQVLQGSKSQFCITDAEEWVPESGASCQHHSCGRQGIAPGCADNYGIDLPCQWLDITGLSPGSYELHVTVNAARSVPELDYANNAAVVQLQIDAQGGSVLGGGPGSP